MTQARSGAGRYPNPIGEAGAPCRSALARSIALSSRRARVSDPGGVQAPSPRPPAPFRAAAVNA
jgi:hypothetical protein